MVTWSLYIYHHRLYIHYTCGIIWVHRTIYRYILYVCVCLKCGRIILTWSRPSAINFRRPQHPFPILCWNKWCTFHTCAMRVYAYVCVFESTQGKAHTYLLGTLIAVGWCFSQKFYIFANIVTVHFWQVLNISVYPTSIDEIQRVFVVFFKLSEWMYEHMLPFSLVSI